MTNHLRPAATLLKLSLSKSYHAKQLKFKVSNKKVKISKTGCFIYQIHQHNHAHFTCAIVITVAAPKYKHFTTNSKWFPTIEIFTPEDEEQILFRCKWMCHSFWVFIGFTNHLVSTMNFFHTHSSEKGEKGKNEKGVFVRKKFCRLWQCFPAFFKLQYSILQQIL